MSDNKKTTQPSSPGNSLLVGLGIILMSNGIPLVGLLYGDWDAYYVSLAIWLDGALKVIFAAVHILLIPAGVTRRWLGCFWMIVFYGGFMTAHGALLIALFVAPQSDGDFTNGISAIIFSPYWQVIALVFIVGYLIELKTNFIAFSDKRFDLARVSTQEVNLRIWMVQIGVLLMALFIVEKGLSPLPALIALILAKTGSDTFFEIRRQKILKDAFLTKANTAIAHDASEDTSASEHSH